MNELQAVCKKKALKHLKNMDAQASSKTVSQINDDLVGCKDPRKAGKALKGEFAGTRRYRVGEYRIPAVIEDDELIIVITEAGHRKNVYA